MRRSKHNPERGIALIAVMFALLLLTGIAMGLMYMAETETSINYNYRTSQMAYFASKAGLEEVRVRLLPPHPITGGGGDLAVAGLPNGRPGDPNSVIYILNPRPGEVVDPTDGGNRTFDNELCHLNYVGLGLANTGYNTPCLSGPPGAPITLTVASLDPYAGTAGSMAYKWVRLTRKVNNTNGAPGGVGTQGWVDPTNLNANEHVCWNGRSQQLKPLANPSCEFDALGQRTRLTTVMVATSLAIAQNGSRRMVSTELALNPPLRTNGAVESEDEVVLNGQLLVSGYDNCRCECVQTKSKTGGTTLTCTDRVTKAACNSGAYSIYSNDVVDDPNKSETLVAPTTPPVAENAPWEQDIPSLIEDFKNAADAVDVSKDPDYNWTCTGSPANCGTHSDVELGTLPAGFPNHDPLNPGPFDNQITYIPGDVKITSNGSVGSGVLVIDGDLEINGGLSFFGIIIVKGVVSFTGGGSDSTNIIGAVLAGKSSIDNTILGGSAVIKYDQCALSQNDIPQPPRTIAFREQAY